MQFSAEKMGFIGDIHLELRWDNVSALQSWTITGS